MAKKIKIKAKKLKPSHVAVPSDTVLQYYHAGKLFLDKGMLDEAIEKFKAVLYLETDFAEAYNNLGIAYAGKGLIDEAVNAFRKATESDQYDAEAANNLGNALSQKGLKDEALRHYRRAVELKPDFASAYSNLGNVLADQAEFDEAIYNFRKALMLTPDDPAVHFNLGCTFKDKGMPDEAIVCHKKALELSPAFVEAYINLGLVLSEQGKPDEAIGNYKKALMLKPDDVDAYNNLGIALRDKGDIEGAEEYFKKAITIQPDYAAGYNNLGIVLQDKGVMNEAVEYFRKALTLDYAYADAHKNLGKVYILLKNFEKGWEENEWRLKTIKVAALKKPKWDGSSLKGKTILVYAEQGFGDTLQFARYLPGLCEDFEAEKVLFIPPKGLENLLRESDLKADILDAETSIERLEYDTNIHLMSLPGIFKTNLENIPFRQKRYLKANPDKVEWYRGKYFIDRKRGSAEVGKSGDEADRKNRSGNDLSLATCNLPLKVGIVWQGSSLFKYTVHKSLPLAHFYPLASLPGIKVYSLQKGDGVEQLKELPNGVEIVNLGETFNDFSDTAAAIENLDLVISVDTSVLHLSGALGKKTWLLHPPYAEWRWHLDMDYSPWYEDMKIFRHKELGKRDWEEMMERVVEEVRKRIACSV